MTAHRREWRCWRAPSSLVGVLVVGALSYAVPSAFPDKTVWSHFGSGYGYVPLVLPVLGIWWLTKVRHAGLRAGPDGTRTDA